MKKFLTGSAVLLFVSCAGAAFAQADAHPSIDALYDQGQRAMAPHWHGLRKTDSAAVFIHADVRKTDHGHVAVWTDHEFAWPEYFEKEKRYLSARDRVVIDCKAGKTGISDSAYYAGHFGAGAVVGTSKAESVDMTDAVPDSMEEQIVRIACAPQPHNSPVHKTKNRK